MTTTLKQTDLAIEESQKLRLTFAGKLIFKKREAEKLTSREFASILGVSQSLVSLWETGTRSLSKRRIQNFETKRDTLHIDDHWLAKIAVLYGHVGLASNIVPNLNLQDLYKNIILEIQNDSQFSVSQVDCFLNGLKPVFSDKDINFFKGRLYTKNKSYEKAVEFFENACSSTQNGSIPDYQINYNFGLAYYNIAAKEAKAIFVKQNGKLSVDQRLQVEREKQRLINGQLVDAITRAKKAFEAQPKYREALILLTMSLYFNFLLQPSVSKVDCLISLWSTLLGSFGDPEYIDGVSEHQVYRKEAPFFLVVLYGFKGEFQVAYQILNSCISQHEGILDTGEPLDKLQKSVLAKYYYFMSILKLFEQDLSKYDFFLKKAREVDNKYVEETIVDEVFVKEWYLMMGDEDKLNEFGKGFRDKNVKQDV